MSTPGEIPEPDRAPGAPHPRETPVLFGQDKARAAFLDAFNSGRLHHGWLITGPRGVGKATLAWQIARFLLANPPGDSGMFAPAPADNLDVPADLPVARRMSALAEPGLFLLRRGWDDKARPPRLKKVITVDEVRKLRGFFALSAPGGGRRVVIVDAADEMNPNAANALLKLLEEPPQNAVLLLVSHQPMRLLPTIRSRCRVLRLAPLGAQDLTRALAQAEIDIAPAGQVALDELAAGSVGDALTLTELGGPKIYADLVSIFKSAPRFERPAALALANNATGVKNTARFDLTVRLILLFIARLARFGAGQPPANEAAMGEATLMTRLSPTADAARRWAALEQELSARASHGKAVNLDPAALILDMIFRINDTAAREAA
ncbi:MAG: DNA polymerase III subunit delta' [Rhodobacteraceae bacterium]|nr:DNA polymerase III subunit delta' [Paracoccaceae bacterium]